MPRRTAIAPSVPSTAPPPASSSSSPVRARDRHASRESQSQPPASTTFAQRTNDEVPSTSPHVVEFSVLPKPALSEPSVRTTAPKKKIIRPPKYHETQAFLRKESAVHRQAELPPHLGDRVGESYRLAATMSRIMKQAALDVRPISWGYGTKDGALGHDNTEFCVYVMKRVAAFRGDYVRQVSAGDKTSLFLTQAGRVFACGRLFLHQDGVKMWRPREISFTSPVIDENSDENNENTRVREPGKEDDIRVVSVEAGHLAAYAIDSQGRVYAWGTHRYGQLGVGDEDIDAFEDEEDADNASSRAPEESDNQEESETEDTDADALVEKPLRRLDPVETAPRRVGRNSLYGIRVTKLSVGNHFVLAMTSCGKVFSWGWNWHGQLGLGPAAPPDGVTSPRPIKDTLESVVVVDIAAGHSHSLIVGMRSSTQDDHPMIFGRYSMVFAFGRGKHGRLGIGGEENQDKPVEVTCFRGLQPVNVAAGHDHSLVLCSLGSQNFVYAFGGNAFGQLGIAQTAMHFSDMPMVVDELTGFTVASIGAGAYVSSALTGDGEVYTWGDGTHGKTGRPDHRTTFVPWKIPNEADRLSSQDGKPNELNHRVVLDGDGFVTQLSMGAHHTLALFRTKDKPDRWRKFPMGPVASSLDVDEGSEFGSLSVLCDSSAAHASIDVFGITLYCETCSIGPLCRICSRRCHRGHRLILRHVSCIKTRTSKAPSVSCACGVRRPTQAPVRLNRQHTAQNQPSKSNITHDMQAKVGAVSEISATEYCTLTSLPTTIPEESLSS